MATGRAMGSRKPMATSKEPTPEYVCPHCGKLKKKSAFYISSDPAVSIGVAFPCKDCAEKIARNYNEKSGKFGEVTLSSLKNALCYLDKPFLEILYDASYKEVHDESLVKPKTNLWSAYIVNVQMPQYKTMRWRDGDLFKNDENNSTEPTLIIQNLDVISECERNKKDIIRLVGYDPYEKEDICDQPLLYSQLIGYLDMSGNNDDMMKISSSITIVRGYLQLQKLDDMIAKAMSNASKTGQSGEIKAYLDAKQKISATISQLAEQSCISLKHNKNATKGENTWTGKVRIMKEMDLREAEVNIFDAETAAGIAQVADISNASILKQIAFDENDYVDMIAQQKQMIDKLSKQANEAIEKARLLLRENIDLKNFIQENNLDISECLSKETILYNE